jgi:hypothetical protein
MVSQRKGMAVTVLLTEIEEGLETVSPFFLGTIIKHPHLDDGLIRGLRTLEEESVATKRGIPLEVPCQGLALKFHLPLQFPSI